MAHSERLRTAPDEPPNHPFVPGRTDQFSTSDRRGRGPNDGTPTTLDAVCATFSDPAIARVVDPKHYRVMAPQDSQPVMRVFRARPSPGCDQDLSQRLVTESVRLVADRDGLLGHIAAGPVDDWFLFVTLWRDAAAVRAFGGDDWEQSVLPDGYDELLDEHHVEHVPLMDWSFRDSGSQSSS